MKEIEQAFKQTTKILLGRELGGVDNYGDWLSKHVPIPSKGKSVVSGKEVWVQPPTCFLNKRFDPDRIIDMDEIGKVNSSHFNKTDLENKNVRDILEMIEPLVYYCGNLRYNTYNNLEKTSGAGEVANVYYSEDVWYGSKNVAFSNLVVVSENIFGSHMSHNSKFCINNYNSFRISRGFEIEGCTNCSDVFFCHNSEGLTNCMLCFNAKSLRYAICNTEVNKETYLKVKRMLLDYVNEKLEKEKALSVDIFNIGCYGGL